MNKAVDALSCLLIILRFDNLCVGLKVGPKFSKIVYVSIGPFDFGVETLPCCTT